MTKRNEIKVDIRFFFSQERHPLFTCRFKMNDNFKLINSLVPYLKIHYSLLMYGKGAKFGQNGGGLLNKYYSKRIFRSASYLIRFLSFILKIIRISWHRSIVPFFHLFCEHNSHESSSFSLMIMRCRCHDETSSTAKCYTRHPSELAFLVRTKKKRCCCESLCNSILLIRFTRTILIQMKTELKRNCVRISNKRLGKKFERTKWTKWNLHPEWSLEKISTIFIWIFSISSRRWWSLLGVFTTIFFVAGIIWEKKFFYLNIGST